MKCERFSHRGHYLVIVNFSHFSGKTQNAAAYVLSIVTACGRFLIFEESERWNRNPTATPANASAWRKEHFLRLVLKHLDPSSISPGAKLQIDARIAPFVLLNLQSGLHIPVRPNTGFTNMWGQIWPKGLSSPIWHLRTGEQ